MGSAGLPPDYRSLAGLALEGLKPAVLKEPIGKDECYQTGRMKIGFAVLPPAVPLEK